MYVTSIKAAVTAARNCFMFFERQQTLFCATLWRSIAMKGMLCHSVARKKSLFLIMPLSCPHCA
jgi:hypothetical protein